MGKSTTCANLGVGLAHAGKKVLSVDCDPQASLTISLGYPHPDDLPISALPPMKRNAARTIRASVKGVEVYRDYKLHIDFDIDLEQFALGITTIAA